MGMYGAGNAFGLNYKPIGINYQQPQVKRHYGPIGARQMPPQQSTTIVNIDNTIGPKGFWGFALGFAQGFLPFLGSKTSNQISTINQTQQAQTAQQPSNNNQLANLKALFGAKFEIVQDSDGRFSATNKSTGELVANNDSYEDTKAKLSGTNTKPKQKSQGTQKPETPAAGTDPKPGTQDPKPDNKYGTAASAKDILGYKGVITVHDGGESRVNGDIKRDNCSFEGGSEKDFPTKIKVGSFEYKFERMDGNHAIYSSVSGNGDEYRLEKNSDGTFALNQYDGDKGFNQVDISAKKQKEIEGG